MRFLRLPISQAAGSVLAHNVTDAEGRRILKKGELLSDRNLGKLTAGGRDFVYVAQFAADDVGEDEAARRVAAAVAGPGVFSPHAATGRANLKATTAGLLRVNVEAIDDLNQIDDGITVATLVTHSFVRAAQMVATVKIIPFAVAQRAVQAVEEYSRTAAPIISIQALPARKVGGTFRRAGGPGEFAADWLRGFGADHRRAGLRALAQDQCLRSRAATAAGGGADHPP